MSALDEYLQEYRPELDFDLGTITANLAALSPEDPGSNRAWANFSLEVSKQIWSALPVDIRSGALFALQEQIDLIEMAADLAVSTAIDALMEVAGIVNAIPIVGAIIEAVLIVVTGVVDTVKGLQGLHHAHSQQEKNREQKHTFEQVTDPTAWAVGLYQINRTEKYFWPSQRIDGQKWRRVPCIVPSYRDPTVWGLSTPPEAIGSCYPGRPITRKLGTYDFRGDEGVNCVSFGAFSSLFWPFWSTNHDARPLQIWGKEVYPEKPKSLFRAPATDPNEILVTRQQAILSNPVTNMRVRGETVRGAEVAFSRYFRDKIFGLGGMIEMRGGDVKLRTTTADSGGSVGSEDGPIDRWTIDRTFDPNHEFDGDVYYYWNPNGLIENYGRGPDLADVGVPAFCPPALNTAYKDHGYSAAQLNTVVAGVKGFFTARAAMLRQPYAMKAILRQNPGRTFFDPMVRAAMRESAQAV